MNESRDNFSITAVNDFQITIATINGTGSQTANMILMHALFDMGIPVNAKNIFPSNIKGMPAWFQIRLSEEGYTARKDISELLVAMNQVTIARDISQLPAGGVCLFDSAITFEQVRNDILYYPLPVDELVRSVDLSPKLREYLRNICYVGALTYLLEIDPVMIKKALAIELGGKEPAIEKNGRVIDAAFDHARDTFISPCPYKVAQSDKNVGKLIMDGNHAAALGAVFGGVQLIAWYPITPSSSIVDAAMQYLTDLRHDPETGKATYAIIQAEDEIAAIGIVIGGGWAGARSMTGTSGPGLSLMTEFAGLAYFTETPAVVWDVQRVGPSTGLPTRTSQGDILMAYTMGHGDTRHILLIPNGIKEAFEYGWKAFDIAERYQTIVFVMSDLDLGMNHWLGEAFDYPDQPMDRGKVLDEEGLQAHIAQYGAWGRYRDVDGDGIPYRTLPGNLDPRAAWFARGTGHNEYAIYTEDGGAWEKNITRIKRKFENARDQLPQPIIKERGSPVGLIAFGTSEEAVREAVDILRQEHDLPVDCLRIRALPLSHEVSRFIERHQRTYVIENNHDGQMARIIWMDFPTLRDKVISISHLDGLPLTAAWVVSSILEKEA